MNILFVINYTKIYGANKSLIDILPFFNKLQLNPVFIFPDSNGMCEYVTENGYKAYVVENLGKHEVLTKTEYKKRDFIRRIYYYADLRLSLPKRVKALCKIIKSENIDIVHTNNSVIIEGALAAEKAHIPHVWHIREMMELHYKMQYTYSTGKIRKLFADTEKIIAISRAVKDVNRYIPKDGNNVCIMHDGIALNATDGTTYGFDENKFTFVITGLLHPSKGVDTAIEAFAKLKKKGINNCKLCIIGDGSYRNTLESLINSNELNDFIEMVGYKDNVYPFFAHCFCGLTCSYMEGLGRTTVEYMLCGKPVIGAASGGTEEIITDNENGLLFEYGNSDDLANKIEYLISSPDIAYSMGKYGKKFAEEHFSPEKYAKDLYKTYEDVKKKIVFDSIKRR